MPITTLLALLAADPNCPNMEGVLSQGTGERILVVEQTGCRLSGTVAEPENQVLHVRGFWTGAGWTMAATRLGHRATTAWGSIRTSGRDTMLINVRGSDGLCGEKGAPGAGRKSFNFVMTYKRLDPR